MTDDNTTTPTPDLDAQIATLAHKKRLARFSDEELQACLDELVLRVYNRAGQLPDECAATSMAFRFSASGSAVSGLKTEWLVCLDSTYAGSDDPRSTNINTAFNEAARRIGYQKANSIKLIGGLDSEV